VKRILALALLTLALAGCQDAAPTFATASVTLPDTEPTFPAGPGVEAVTNNCAACHSPDMILNQPKQTREQWAKSIDKMRKIFKAEIAEADEAAILDYLAGVSVGVE
jgi:mono/diheme cytochrome c family protein